MSGRVVHSWGRFPDHPQTAHPVFWRDELPAMRDALTRTHGSTLAYGNGRSYGDACMASSDHVLDLRPLDRWITADWQSGIVRVEAGLTLEALIEIALPRGWFVQVTPGTKFATLGGCVANDVHGKNHHVRGTFGRHVRRLGLLRSDRGFLECSPTEFADLFCATVGGLGLTGIVAWIELQLMPVASCELEYSCTRFSGLDEFFALSTETDDKHEYSVAWIDCRATGRAFGRGIYEVADHASDGGLVVPAKCRLRVPVTLPFSAVNRYSVVALNHFYYYRQRNKRVAGRVDQESFFYPLDRILEWNRMYGRRGFQQFQCVVPQAHAPDAIRELLAAITASGEGSSLSVLKRCGAAASPGWLSFPMAGTSLALDFARSAAVENSLFGRLDAIVRAAGGRLYAAKDAHMSADDFKTAYPNWQKVEALRDPALISRFWARVTQV